MTERLLFPEADGLKAAWIDPQRGQEPLDDLSAPRPERQVVLFASPLVGMALNHNLCIRIGDDELGILLEDRFRFFSQGSLVKFEEDIVQSPRRGRLRRGAPLFDIFLRRARLDLLFLQAARRNFSDGA